MFFYRLTIKNLLRSETGLFHFLIGYHRRRYEMYSSIPVARTAPSHGFFAVWVCCRMTVGAAVLSRHNHHLTKQTPSLTAFDRLTSQKNKDCTTRVQPLPDFQKFLRIIKGLFSKSLLSAPVSYLAFVAISSAIFVRNASVFIAPRSPSLRERTETSAAVCSFSPITSM